MAKPQALGLFARHFRFGSSDIKLLRRHSESDSRRVSSRNDGPRSLTI